MNVHSQFSEIGLPSRQVNQRGARMSHPIGLARKLRTGMTETQISTRPTVEARRQQILDAAADCFRQSGFHGASMAEIAKTANLSVGQIYRYFDNKEAIVEAIVDRDSAEKREKFADFHNYQGDLREYMVANCCDAVDRFADPERATLMLEIVAEAARNPKVAAILQKRDAEERDISDSFIERIRRPEWSEEDAVQRGEMIGMLFEGMAVRSINNPDLDKAAVTRLLKVVMAALLEVELPPEK